MRTRVSLAKALKEFKSSVIFSSNFNTPSNFSNFSKTSLKHDFLTFLVFQALLESVVLLPTANAIRATALSEFQALEFRLENAWRVVSFPGANLATATTRETIRVFLALEKRRGRD